MLKKKVVFLKKSIYVFCIKIYKLCFPGPTHSYFRDATFLTSRMPRRCTDFIVYNTIAIIITTKTTTAITVRMMRILAQVIEIKLKLDFFFSQKGY